jgi:hypothetical protein
MAIKPERSPIDVQGTLMTVGKITRMMEINIRLAVGNQVWRVWPNAHH